MDLRRMSHVVALADERHFGRAAERVHLSQPAFSRSIQAAEAEVGLTLFDRGTVEVTCTPAGQYYIARARRLLFDVRCLERDASLYRERLLGDIAFGGGPYPAITLLQPLMVELRTRFAGVHSHVEVNNGKYLVEQLRAERLDFVVVDVNQTPADADLVRTVVTRQRGAFFVHAGHPLKGRKGLSPTEVRPYGVASTSLPPRVRALLREALGLPPQADQPLELECNDLSLAKHVALSTDTVLGCIDAAVSEEVATQRLFKLDVVGLPVLETEIGVVALKGRTLSPMAEYAVAFITRLGAQKTDPAAQAVS